MRRYKVVTLDGQQVNVGGSITGGSSNNTHNFIKDKHELESRKLELDSLKEKIEYGIKNISDVTSEIQAREQLLHVNKNKIFDLRQEILQREEKKSVDSSLALGSLLVYSTGRAKNSFPSKSLLEN